MSHLKNILREVLYTEEYDPQSLTQKTLIPFNSVVYDHELRVKNCPYYHIYPEVFEAVSGTTLELAIDDWRVPFGTFEIRMPKTAKPLIPIHSGSPLGVMSIQVFRNPWSRIAFGYDNGGVESLLTYKYARKHLPQIMSELTTWSKDIGIKLNICHYELPNDMYHHQSAISTVRYRSGTRIRDAVAHSIRRALGAEPGYIRDQSCDDISALAWEKSIKLALGVSLLATGSHKILEADVLSKHFDAYRAMRAKGDVAGCKAIEAKAKQKGKFGWNIGKPTDRRLPLSQNAPYPHSEGKGSRHSWGSIRCGHWHKYRVGAGRTTVKIRWVNPTTVRPDLPLRQTA